MERWQISFFPFFSVRAAIYACKKGWDRGRLIVRFVGGGVEGKKRRVVVALEINYTWSWNKKNVERQYLYFSFVENVSLNRSLLQKRVNKWVKILLYEACIGKLFISILILRFILSGEGERSAMISIVFFNLINLVRNSILLVVQIENFHPCNDICRINIMKLICWMN